jgi:hypothetical protein
MRAPLALRSTLAARKEVTHMQKRHSKVKRALAALLAVASLAIAVPATSYANGGSTTTGQGGGGTGGP